MTIENVVCTRCGVVYEVNTDVIDGATFICGGCYEEMEQDAYLECLRSDERGKANYARRHERRAGQAD